MKNPLGVSPSKRYQGTTRGKEKILMTSVGIEPTTSGLDLPLLCRLSYEVGQDLQNSARSRTERTKQVKLIKVSLATLKMQFKCFISKRGKGRLKTKHFDDTSNSSRKIILCFVLMYILQILTTHLLTMAFVLVTK